MFRSLGRLTINRQPQPVQENRKNVKQRRCWQLILNHRSSLCCILILVLQLWMRTFNFGNRIIRYERQEAMMWTPGRLKIKNERGPSVTCGLTNTAFVVVNCLCLPRDIPSVLGGRRSPKLLHYLVRRRRSGGSLYSNNCADRGIVLI